MLTKKRKRHPASPRLDKPNSQLEKNVPPAYEVKNDKGKLPEK
jgi:hypothetical protein